MKLQNGSFIIDPGPYEATDSIVIYNDITEFNFSLFGIRCV